MTDNPSPLPLTRRRLVRAAGTAAWAAPVIVAASAAPAYAASPGAPSVSTSGIDVNRSPSSTLTMDATMTFTNNGNAAAASLTVVINIRIIAGAYSSQITGLTPGWAVSGPVDNPTGGRDFTFSRPAGIGTGVANAQPLAFTFTAFNPGDGVLTVLPPTTDPTGVNTGGVASFGLVSTGVG